MSEYTQKYAFVTGSSRGIGRAIALRLAAEGYHIFLNCARSFDALEETRQEIEKIGTCTLVPGDIGNPDTVRKIFHTIAETCDHLDVLVNNAGISQKVTVADITLDDIKRIFSVNMFGLFLITQAVCEVMKKQKYGRIVHLSSVSGKRGGGVFGGAHYSASKAAVLGFSKNLAREVSQYGITTNCVCPGLINTEIWKSMPKEQADAVIAGIPMGRPGETQVVANAIVFLASKEASYITGEEIDINGGSHMD